MSKITDQVMLFVFVDDTDLVEGNLRSTTDDLEEVTERMQNSINFWEGSLKATEGAIRPDKSFVHPINFIFKNSGK